VIKTATGLLVLLLALQDDPNLKYLKDRGFSIAKPKKDEWQFKDAGRINNSQVVVMHAVDEVTFEMYGTELDANKVGYDPKLSLDTVWKSLSSNPQYKDARQVGKIQTTTLPGNGAGGQKVWLLEMTMTTAQGPLEWKAYFFNGRENRSAYIIHIVTGQGLYAKHKADIESMLSSIRTYKIVK
jgi:hypothetical protein